MASDLVVALGAATVQGGTWFGANVHGPANAASVLARVAARDHSPGGTFRAQQVELPQTRQTFAVLGCRTSDAWGLCHGVNEHHVAAGCASWQSKLAITDPVLTGHDLVRLILERSRSARQALEVLTDLIARHGQASSDGDNVFLVADAREAFVVEATGTSWAAMECSGVRAVSDVGLARQDWLRLSPGLAEQAIARGWWPDDGSKLDFAGALSGNPIGAASALRRWGRATLLLEQQHGHIDTAFLRRLLGDHYEGTRFEVDPLASGDGPKPLCRHASDTDPTMTLASFLAPLSAADVAIPAAWWAFGPPCAGVYVPIFMFGDLPDAYLRPASNPIWKHFAQTQGLAQTHEEWQQLRQNLTQLQSRIDQETEDFVADAAAWRQNPEALRRQATFFMQSHCELVCAEYRRWPTPQTGRLAASTSGGRDEASSNFIWAEG